MARALGCGSFSDSIYRGILNWLFGWQNPHRLRHLPRRAGEPFRVACFVSLGSRVRGNVSLGSRVRGNDGFLGMAGRGLVLRIVPSVRRPSLLRLW